MHLDCASTMNLEPLFTQVFHSASTVHASSPGRVNLIGEHTDYNEGLVLPTPIAQRCEMLFGARADDRVEIHSVQMQTQAGYALGKELAGHTWLDYVQAITQELHRASHTLHGFNAVVSSDVPLGSGLSSSASFLVTIAKGLRELFKLEITDVQIALLAQAAENGLVGARVGLMDQMACSLGKAGEALLIDFRTLEYRSIQLPKTMELVILHSGLTHSLAGHEAGTRNYKTRRLECERACELLGVRSLRDLELSDLERVAALPAPFAGRARHVITENARVLETVAALEAGDLRRVGELFYASHASMNTDYDVSEPEIDLIVQIAGRTTGIYGARLTGGGFGGSVVMIADKGTGRVAGEAVMLEYAQATGQSPRLLSPAF